MKKWISTLTLLSTSALLTPIASAQNDMWRGVLYEITPKSTSVTMDYCKSHVPDTYEASKDMIEKEITAANGVKAKNLGFTTKETGGIYFTNGTAMLSGETNGKKWEEKVSYFSHSLQKDGMKQGAWYTKDCKGFYKIAPVSAMDSMGTPITTTPTPADTTTPPNGTMNGGTMNGSPTTPSNGTTTTPPASDMDNDY